MSNPSPPGGAYPPPPPGYPPQGQPPPGYPPPGYPPQGYPPQGYPPQGYPPQGYPPQGYAQGAPYGPGPAARSAAPRVFGILSLCFGALGALGSGFIAMVGLLATKGLSESKGPEDAPLIAMFLTVAVWATLLLAVGVGQVKYRHWSLSATWVWSVTAIVVAVVCAVGFVVVVPVRQTAVGFAFMAVMLLPYPILMMVFFARPKVRESLEG